MKKLPSLFLRVDQLELSSCLRLNSYCQRLMLKRFFVIISRLGDGMAWYVCLLLLPVLFGLGGLTAAVCIAVTTLICTLLYKFLKGSLIRTRPFLTSPYILCATPPLDQYSFPSGHTMHAVCFTTMLIEFYPPAALLLIPFTIAIGFSRVILGLHYPSDVAAGALLGWVVAHLGLAVAAAAGTPLAASTFVY